MASQYRKQDPTCTICKGLGYVMPVVCEGCGRAAIMWAGGVVPYCGAEACLRVQLPQAERKGRIYSFPPNRPPKWDAEWFAGLAEDSPEGYCC